MTERPKLTLERTYRASIDEVWELWTTKEGIESWWGPDGFTVVVRGMDLRPGGELLYTMRAVGLEQQEYMLKAGMPVSTDHKIVYVSVEPPRRLIYRDIADFIPGVDRYEIETIIELHEVDEGVRMVCSFDRMHNEEWTRLAVTGHEMELGRLARVLAARE